MIEDYEHFLINQAELTPEDRRAMFWTQAIAVSIMLGLFLISYMLLMEPNVPPKPNPQSTWETVVTKEPI